MLVLLTSSQAIAATSINVSTFNEGEDYSTAITFVGTSALDSAEITKSEWGTYDVVSDNNIKQITFKVNFTGLTVRLDTANTTGMLNSTYTYEFNTVGQFNVIVDGNVISTGAYTSPSGSIVTLNGYGDHIVTFVYYGYDASGNFVYASDAAIVRMRASASEFKSQFLIDIPFVSSYTDSAVAGQEVDNLENYVYTYWASEDLYYITGKNGDRLLDIEDKTDFKLSSYKDEETGNVNGIEFGGTIDSTGSKEIVLDDLFPSKKDANNETVVDLAKVKTTKGHVFVIDAKGAHLDDGSIETISIINSADGQTGLSTYVGAMVVPDADLWVASDWEGLPGGDSYEFWSVLQGFYVPDAGEDSYTEVANGLNATLAIFTLGVIAFVIPRKFRK